MRRICLLCMLLLSVMVVSGCSQNLSSSGSKTSVTNCTAAEHDVLKLWPNRTAASTEKVIHPKRKGGIIRLTNINIPTITLYKTTLKADTPTPAVVVCPGGGYKILAINKEGTDIAEWLNSFGITAVVLKYTVPNNRDAAFADAQRAIRLVRSHSKEWNIDPNRVGIMGFSAGGHLSARASTNFDKRAYTKIDKADELSCRPDFTILVYPAYIEDRNHRRDKGITVTKKTPPAFIMQTQYDRSYVNSSIRYYLDMKKAYVPAELHLFPLKGHGYGLAKGRKGVSQWPKLCENWLKAVTGL